MKYIKTFEETEAKDVKKYVIVTMTRWDNDVFMLETSKVDNSIYYYSKFYMIERDKIKVTESNQSYFLDDLIILYQTNDFEAAKNQFIELQKFYNEIKKYNL